MYIQKVEIKNIRSISHFEMTFQKPAGWHVLIGDNGVGKTTILQSIALKIAQVFVTTGDIDFLIGLYTNNWLKQKENEGYVYVTVKGEKEFDDHPVLEQFDNDRPFSLSKLRVDIGKDSAGKITG